MHSHARTSAKIDATLFYVAVYFVLFLSPEIARRSSQIKFEPTDLKLSRLPPRSLLPFAALPSVSLLPAAPLADRTDDENDEGERLANERECTRKNQLRENHLR